MDCMEKLTTILLRISKLFTAILHKLGGGGALNTLI
jgi:hypothetical protein